MNEPIDGVDPEELKAVENVVDKKTAELSDQEVTDFFGDNLEEEYIDATILKVRKARALIMYWHGLSSDVSSVKEGYHLAKKWDDEDLKKQYIEQGRPMVKKLNILEGELKEALPELKGKVFLRDDELELLPKWMLKLIGAV